MENEDNVLGNEEWLNNIEITYDGNFVNKRNVKYMILEIIIIIWGIK